MNAHDVIAYTNDDTYCVELPSRGSGTWYGAKATSTEVLKASLGQPASDHESASEGTLPRALLCTYVADSRTP